MRAIVEATVRSERDGDLRVAAANAFSLMEKHHSRRRVLFLVDNQEWCWTTTAKQIAKHVTDHEFLIATCREFKADPQGHMDWCDIIYMRGYANSFFDGLKCTVTKPYIWTLCTGGAQLQKRLAENEDYIGAAAACVVQSEEAKAAALAAGACNVWLIPNGVDIDRFHPAEDRFSWPLYAGFAGNNEGERGELKGYSLARDACDRLNVPLKVACLKNRVTPEDMPEFYRGLFAYIQPSAAEGCSNSVMEAMASGVPCVITRGVGYHGEACDDTDVVFADRTTESVTNAIRRLQDKDFREKISAGAIAFARRHSWPKMAVRHQCLINSIPVRTTAPPPDAPASPPASVALRCSDCRYFAGRADDYKVSGLVWCGYSPDVKKVTRRGNIPCFKMEEK